MATSRSKNNRREARRKKSKQRININRVKNLKLVAMMTVILIAFVALGIRLYLIARDNQYTYQKKILSQQQYDSTTLPYKRGSILDANGTILATSEKVYNVILDTKLMRSDVKEENEDSKNEKVTLSALVECFDLDMSELETYVKENPSSQYKVLKKKITYDEMSPFLDKKSEQNALAAKDEELGKITGVWFEEEYIRRYPNNTLACDVIGFATGNSAEAFGLEGYYNDVLSGTNGREYGYLNDDSTLERTTVAAVDGYTLVTTLDANVQAICEKYIKQFNEEHYNEFREGNGAENIGVIIQNINSGEIIAMASYPDFDLNNPRDLTAYYSDEEIAQMEADDTTRDALNALWRNFCISDTYEPGSTAKAITLATGIETGKILGNETYNCPGYADIADRHIRCNARSGHGVLDVSGSIEQSCNVAFMKMGEVIGAKTMLKFEQIFNIGLKTNIDLPGEARTASLVFNENTMGTTELATSAFGQGFNVTMIEMITAFSSIVNGGYYYEPHVVSKITNSDGDTITNIEPRVLKQTISETTSEQMVKYLYNVVAEGTGKSARPAGYEIGGKTGTAETAARDKTNYVVSFIGFAPADDPQIAIYCVVDRPNVEKQASASYATGIVKNILTEVLPYMHISKTVEMTVTEEEEVNAVLGNIVQSDSQDDEAGDNGEDGENDDDNLVEDNENQDNGGAFYVVDPDTGELKDPVTGEPADIDYSLDMEDDVSVIEQPAEQ